MKSSKTLVRAVALLALLAGIISTSAQTEGRQWRTLHPREIAAPLNSVSALSRGQIRYPVTWTFAAKKKPANTYEVMLTAVVEKPWHIFSQNTGKGGPIPTQVSFKANALQTVVGKAKENGKLEKGFDQSFKTNVLFYSNKVQFIQTVKVQGQAKTTLSGTVEYMVCDDTQCLPPTKKSFDLTLQ